MALSIMENSNSGNSMVRASCKEQMGQFMRESGKKEGSTEKESKLRLMVITVLESGSRFQNFKKPRRLESTVITTRKQCFLGLKTMDRSD